MVKDRNDEREKEPDISVVIPVYDVAGFLEDCLMSVICQSKQDIEIICIDDASTDGSLRILERMASADRRVHILRTPQNMGSLAARKAGVLAAKGHYIMFLDGDDRYVQDACRRAHAAIVERKVDILQFGTKVMNTGKAPQSEVDHFVRFVTPYKGRSQQPDIVRDCFIKEAYSYNLWNKIYDAALCKRAFLQLDDGHYCMAEDMLAYFVLSCLAESFAGIPDKLYEYNFAVGISRPGQLDLEGLDRRCCGAESIHALSRILSGGGISGDHSDAYQKAERRIFLDNLYAWYYRLPQEQRKEGYAILEAHWGKDKIIQGLLHEMENMQADIDRRECELNSLSYKTGRIMTWIPRKLAGCGRRAVRRLCGRK